MTPDQALDMHRRMINAIGEDILVRRYSGVGPSRTHVDTTTKARVMSYSPKEIVGAVVQGDIRVIALIDTLTSMLPLTVDDKLVIRGAEKAIKAVDDNTRRVQGVIVALEIQARG